MIQLALDAANVGNRCVIHIHHTFNADAHVSFAARQQWQYIPDLLCLCKASSIHANRIVAPLPKEPNEEHCIDATFHRPSLHVSSTCVERAIHC